ncbi:unnamed protein product [Absidia cylindrospora]
MARRDFVRAVYGDRYFLSHLGLHKELVGHQGCVNALYWSQYGDKLLSGSDDQTLRIWYPFEGGDYQKKVVIKTGHRDNIFAAKFMPNTADQIVISAAGDSELRIFDLNGAPNEQLQHVYTCHSDPVKRICTEAYNPYEFLTCSEDGTVRHFDLRQPHTCTPHYIRSFNTAVRQHSRHYTSQHRTVSPRPLRQGCPKPLLDYSQYGLDINSMTINKHRPQYFVIAGMDDFMYLHDRRMICSSSFDHGAGRNVDNSPASQCVLRFAPSDNQPGGSRRGNRYITACRFSDSNGYELLGNWAASGAYLFNILDTPVESKRWTSTLKQSSAPALERLRQYQQKQRSPLSPVSIKTSSSSPLPSLATDPMTPSHDDNDENILLDDDDDDNDDDSRTSMIPDRTKFQLATNRESVIQAMEVGDLSHALRLLNNHYLYLQHGGGGNESSLDSQTPRQRDITRLEHTWLHCMTAVIFATRATRNIKRPGFDRTNFNDERTRSVHDDLTAIRVQIGRAQQIAPKNWKGMWCFVITHWLISGGDVGAQERQDLEATTTTTKSMRQSLLPGIARYIFDTSHFASKVLVLFSEMSSADRYEIAKNGYARLFIYYSDLMHLLVTAAKVDLDRLAGIKKESTTYRRHAATTTTDHHRKVLTPPSSSTSSSQSSSSSSSSSLPMSPMEDQTDWFRLLYPFPFPTAASAAATPGTPSDRLLYNGVLMNPRLHGKENYIPTEDEMRSVMRQQDDEDEEDEQHDDNDMEDEDETNSDEDDDDDEDSDDDDDDSDELGRVMDYLSVDDHFFDSGLDDDDPSDSSNGFDQLERHQRSIRTDFQSDVGIIGHRQKFTGHGNIRTIKDVNFYGAQDEYIVSGSDDGRAFIWDKKTGNIVQILKADQDTVNVIQGHPFLPYLAISGIDDTIKIFTPTGSNSLVASSSSSSSSLYTSQMDQADDIAARNARYHRDRQRESFLTRSFLENMSRLYRQRHPDWVQMDIDTDDDDDNDDDDGDNMSDLFSSGAGDMEDDDNDDDDS